MNVLVSPSFGRSPLVSSRYKRFRILAACALWLCLIAGHRTANAQQFLPYVNYETARGPIAVALGDFNGDGKLDLATSIYVNDFVSVLLGNGDGTFQTHVDYGTGGDSPWIAVGDFNGDGKLDLVTSNYNTGNTVSVFLGDGDGTFQAHVDYSTGAAPYSVAVGDFNGDGKLDLVTANFSGSTVSVLLGNGDGTFQGHMDYATQLSPESVTVGDFNGDGILDLAVGSASSNSVSILLGNGDGTFRKYVNYQGEMAPYDVAVADVNGDGKLDLVAPNACCDTVSILLGNGDGTFQKDIEYNTGPTPYGVAVGDFNGDGKLDLVTVNYTGNSVSLLLGNGDGTVQPNVDSSAGFGPADIIAAGDFNGDGAIDVVVTNFDAGGASTVSVLLNAGPGGGSPKVAFVPASLNFGQRLLNTSSTNQIVTVSNVGVAALDISSVSLTGAGAGDYFLLNGCGATLAADANCSLEVGFRPFAQGTHPASISIADNAANSPQTVALNGTGTALSLSASSLSFGSVTVGSSISQTLKLSNVGRNNLSIEGVQIVGTNKGDYSQSNNCGTSIPAKSSCAIKVTFTPVRKGPLNATLGFTTNGSGMNATTSVPLAGTGK